LLLLAAGAGIVALARPQWGVRLEPIERRGVDVVLVLDTSLSMATQDAAPDRLGLARHAAGELIRRLGGDRVALVTFAGKATLSCPLTLDHEAARLFLDSVDVESVPVPGTALAEAVRAGLRAFGPEGADAAREGQHRAIVLFSDGEDHEGELDAAIAMARRAGVTVHAVGCGSTAGAPIPERDASGSLTGYKKDREGRVVTSRLDEASLEKLALETEGRYYRATPAGGEVEEIARALAGMDAREHGTVLRTRYEDRFQYPLVLALAALLAETFLDDRRRRKRGPSPGPREDT
jgi:Ca-activated chloride channel family protein